MKQLENEELMECTLSRLQIAEMMQLKYSTLCAKLNGYLSFNPVELEKLRAIIKMYKRN